MNYKIILIALTTIFISCSNDKKTTEVAKQVSKIKSDLLLTNSAIKPFSNPNSSDTLTILVNGKSLLNSTTTLKVTNALGKELRCESIATILLLNPEYKTANSALKEVQIRETVANLFQSDSYLAYFTKGTYANNEYEEHK